MSTHPSFARWMEAVALPLRDQLRLDGQTTGGNRSSAGRFRHGGETWRVHADTHLEPLLLAHEATLAGRDPFVVNPSGTTPTLVLVDDLQQRRKTRHKHLYIYLQR